MIRRNRWIFAASALFLAACGGGGRSSLPVASTAPTIAPSIGPTLSILSAPAGLKVAVNAQLIGVTPLSVRPTSSNATQEIRIITHAPNGDFDVPFEQIFSNQTIYYNAAVDVSGTLSYIATTPSRVVHRLPNRTLVPPAALEYVIFTPGVSARRMNSVLYSHGLSMKYLFADSHLGGGVAVAAPLDARRSMASLRDFAGEPSVSSVLPVRVRWLQSISPVLPNDTHFGVVEQWDMFRSNFPLAWAYSFGKPSISIAVIDTGWDASQKDLASKVVLSESVIDGSITTGSTATQDTDGHGTNVSGIAGAQTNDAIGFAGSGYNATLQEYKIFANGATGASTADEAIAIEEALKNGARIINLSLGSPEASNYDPVEYDAIEDAVAHGVVVVAAAGNESASTLDYPAAYPGVISVGASALADNDTGDPTSAVEYVASYSNYGPGLTLVAPGGEPLASFDDDPLHWIYNLYTTTPYDVSQKCSNTADCNAFLAGTSQAAPHVSGAIALMLSLDPSLTPSQTELVLQSTADDIGDSHQGAGRLDAYRAVAAVNGQDPGVPPYSINFVAFAYDSSTAPNVPHILDQTFTHGSPLDRAGHFRIADFRPTAPYRIGIWADTNGDGVVDAGDYFGSSTLCQPTSPCTAAATITVSKVEAGFVLP